jgi:hypothetical protein
MATRIFGRMHVWICMILLLAVAATLLPAHGTSAAEQKVLISKPQLDLVVWNAHSDLLLSRAQRIEALIRTELLNVSHCTAEDLAELQRRYLNDVDIAVGGGAVNHDKRDNLPYQTLAEMMLNAASSMPIFQSDGTTDVIGKVWSNLSAVRSISQANLPTDYEGIAKGVRAYWPNVPLDPQNGVTTFFDPAGKLSASRSEGCEW